MKVLVSAVAMMMRPLLALAAFGSRGDSALLAGLVLILAVMAMALFVTRPALVHAAARPPDLDQLRRWRRFSGNNGCSLCGYLRRRRWFRRRSLAGRFRCCSSSSRLGSR